MARVHSRTSEGASWGHSCRVQRWARMQVSRCPSSVVIRGCGGAVSSVVDGVSSHSASLRPGYASVALAAGVVAMSLAAVMQRRCGAWLQVLWACSCWILLRMRGFHAPGLWCGGTTASLLLANFSGSFELLFLFAGHLGAFVGFSGNFPQALALGLGILFSVFTTVQLALQNSLPFGLDTAGENRGSPISSAEAGTPMQGFRFLRSLAARENHGQFGIVGLDALEATESQNPVADQDIPLRKEVDESTLDLHSGIGDASSQIKQLKGLVQELQIQLGQHCSRTKHNVEFLEEERLRLEEALAAVKREGELRLEAAQKQNRELVQELGRLRSTSQAEIGAADARVAQMEAQLLDAAQLERQFELRASQATELAKAQVAQAEANSTAHIDLIAELRGRLAKESQLVETLEGKCNDAERRLRELTESFNTQHAHLEAKEASTSETLEKVKADNAILKYAAERDAAKHENDMRLLREQLTSELADIANRYDNQLAVHCGSLESKATTISELQKQLSKALETNDQLVQRLESASEFESKAQVSIMELGKQLDEAHSRHLASQEEFIEKVRHLEAQKKMFQTQAADVSKNAEAERNKLSEAKAADLADLQDSYQQFRERAQSREDALKRRVGELEVERNRLELETLQSCDERDRHVRIAAENHRKLEEQLRDQRDQAKEEANRERLRSTQLEAALKRQRDVANDAEARSKIEFSTLLARAAGLEANLQEQLGLRDGDAQSSSFLVNEIQDLRLRVAEGRRVSEEANDRLTEAELRHRGEVGDLTAEIAKLRTSLEDQVELSHKIRADYDRRIQVSQLQAHELQIQLAAERGAVTAAAREADAQRAAFKAQLEAANMHITQKVEAARAEGRSQAVAAADERCWALQTSLAQQRGASAVEVKLAAERISELEVQLEMHRLGYDVEAARLAARTTAEQEKRLHRSEIRVAELEQQLAQRTHDSSNNTNPVEASIHTRLVALEARLVQMCPSVSGPLAATPVEVALRGGLLSTLERLEDILTKRLEPTVEELKLARRRIGKLEMELASEHQLREGARKSAEERIAELQSQVDRQRASIEVQSPDLFDDRIRVLLESERTSVLIAAQEQNELERRRNETQERWLAARILELEAMLEAAIQQQQKLMAEERCARSNAEVRVEELSSELASLQADMNALCEGCKADGRQRCELQREIQHLQVVRQNQDAEARAAAECIQQLGQRLDEAQARNVVATQKAKTPATEDVHLEVESSHQYLGHLASLHETVMVEARATERVSELARALERERFDLQERLRIAMQENAERQDASELAKTLLKQQITELEKRVVILQDAPRAGTSEVAVQTGDSVDPPALSRGIRIGGGYHIWRAPAQDEARSPRRSRQGLEVIHVTSHVRECLEETVRPSPPSREADHVTHSYAHGAPARSTSAERYRVGAQVGDRSVRLQGTDTSAVASAGSRLCDDSKKLQLFRVLGSGQMKHSRSDAGTPGRRVYVTQGPIAEVKPRLLVSPSRLRHGTADSFDLHCTTRVY